MFRPPTPAPPGHQEDKTRDGITDRMEKIFRKLRPASKFINLSFARDSNRYTDRLCPTITTAGNIWCVPLQRYASVSELLALQGFPIDFRFAGRYHKKMIGNTMSVNVICAVFRSIFQSVA
jgi:site-specific DNA-cytosine methylase